jgi:hypothetical protein
MTIKSKGLVVARLVETSGAYHTATDSPWKNR